MMGTRFPAAHPPLPRGSVAGPADGSGGRVPAGSTVYTCMLNRRGGVESDLTVSRISPGAPGSPLAPAFEGKTLSPGMLEGSALFVFTLPQFIISELSFILIFIYLFLYFIINLFLYLFYILFLFVYLLYIFIFYLFSYLLYIFIYDYFIFIIYLLFMSILLVNSHAFPLPFQLC